MEDQVVLASQIKEDIDKQPKVGRFSFGYDNFDKFLHEIAEGDFIVIGGIAGSGKTLLAISITKNLIRQKIMPLWFSIEMPPREFLLRFDPDYYKFFTMPRRIEVPRMTWLERKIDEGIEKFGVKVVFIDHLGMIVDESDVRTRTGLEIYDERLKTIKSWAVLKSIVIVGISTAGQETAKAGKRKEPTLADFRGSSMVGHTSDVALVIKRMVGVKQAQDLTDLLDEDSFLSSESRVYIIKCRRSGVMKGYIPMVLNNKGNLVEQLEDLTEEEDDGGRT